MILKCLIVEDELTARNILKRYISEMKILTLAGECKNAMEAVDFLSNESVDILFLDIEMPRLSGLDFIRSLHSRPNIIVTTAYREFALDGFNLDVKDYLLKPISFDRFVLAVNKITEANAKRMENDYTYFKSGQKNIQIFYDDILYIEGLSNYIKIHTRQKIVITYEKLSSLINKLPSSNFIRIHKSHIVAVNKVTAFGNHQVEIDKVVLSIGDTYKEEFLKRMAAH